MNKILSATAGVVGLIVALLLIPQISARSAQADSAHSRQYANLFSARSISQGATVATSVSSPATPTSAATALFSPTPTFASTSAPTSTPTSTSVTTPTSTPATGCVSTWAYVTKPPVNPFNAIAAVSHLDAWVLYGDLGRGFGGTYRWDGSSWHPVPVPTPSGRVDALILDSISARQADDVWAAGWYDISMGRIGLIYHWDGSAWNTVLLSQGGRGATFLEGITQIGPNEAIAVGWDADYGGNGYPIIIHCMADGECTTTTQPAFAEDVLDAVDASSPSDVWAGGGGLLEHYDGSTWHVVSSPNIGEQRSISVIAPNDVWVAGDTGLIHWNGSSWDEGENRFGVVMSVSGVASNDVWATAMKYGDSTAHILHWDGTQWSIVFDGPFNRIDALTANDVWAAGGNIARYQTIQQFEDVVPNSAFYYYANDLACRSIISGYPCGSSGEPCDPYNRPYFRPGANITRAQLSKIIALSANLPTPSPTQVFEDVPLSSPFWPYIDALYIRGAINGYPCGRRGEPCGHGNRPYFRPNTTTTRGQIAKIVAITANLTDPIATQTFEDVPVGSTFYLWIENLAHHGIVGGYPCGGSGEPCGPNNLPYFRPGANVTRGQLSKIDEITFFP